MMINDDGAGCGTDQTRRLAVGDDVVHEDGEVSVMVPQSSQALERPVVFQLALPNSSTKIRLSDIYCNILVV